MAKIGFDKNNKPYLTATKDDLSRILDKILDWKVLGVGGVFIILYQLINTIQKQNEFEHEENITKYHMVKEIELKKLEREEK